MNTDRTLKQQVLEVLERDQSLPAEAIAVSVHDEVVSLYGRTETAEYAARAESLTKLVPGVRALTNEIEVEAGRDPAEFGDYDLARAIRNDFKQKPYLGFDRIFVKVKDRGVTLEGEVNWGYQIRLAEQYVQRIGGAAEIVNLLQATSELSRETVAGSVGRMAV
jgi:osmotically-inducible protein OsmY